MTSSEGFETDTTPSMINELPATGDERRGIPTWLERGRHNPTFVLGAVMCALILLAALLAPHVSPFDPYTMNMQRRLLGPLQNGHLLGTDEFGRDLLTRLLYGAQASLTVGFLSVAVAFVIGVPIGLITGFYGGWIDMIVMRIVDVVLSFPFLLLAIALVAALGPGISNVIIALAAVSWTSYARVVRASVLAAKEEEYVQASRTVGSRNWRIMVYTILPNCLAPVVVMATLGIGQAIVAEATMSFLGLGIQPPQASWGWILAYGMRYLQEAPHLSLFAGLAIMVTVLGFNLFGDGIRDVMDTKL